MLARDFTDNGVRESPRTAKPGGAWGLQKVYIWSLSGSAGCNTQVISHQYLALDLFIFQWQNKKIKSMLTYIVLFQPCQIGSRQLSFSLKSSLKTPECPLQLLKTVSRCWMKNSWIYLKPINVYWSFQKHLNT